MIKNRIRKVVDILQQRELDAMLFTDMTNIRYLTGFTGSEAVVVLSASGVWFLCDSRYTTQAVAQIDCEVVEYKSKHLELIDLLRQKCLKKVGFESSTVSFAEYHNLEKISGNTIQWVAIEDLSTLRLLKDQHEIELIERATSISAQAFNDTVSLIVPGVTENKVSLALEMSLRHLGCEAKSFEFIVASGERGSMPHGVASDKKVSLTDLVTVDFGGRYNGYYSDETVTCAVGEPDEKMRKVFDIVLEAHDRAIEIIKPGVPLKEIDAAARDFISSCGYGDSFGHGLGHGVGLEVHEAPRVSPLSKGLTEVGMVFTVEPGIYLPGLGGVRIEDIVVVTEEGCRILTRLPKDFRRLN